MPPLEAELPQTREGQCPTLDERLQARKNVVPHDHLALEQFPTLAADPFKAEIAGSNPAGVTISGVEIPTGRSVASRLP